MGKKVKVDDQYLRCPICKKDTFLEGSIKFTAAGKKFSDINWKNQEAVTFVCDTCGYILSFHTDYIDQHEIEEEQELEEKIKEAQQRAEKADKYLV